MVDGLVGQTVTRVYAGNQHSCCITAGFNPLRKLHAEQKCGLRGGVRLRAEDQSAIMVHQFVLRAYTD